jgi:hypothetical protein
VSDKSSGLATGDAPGSGESGRYVTWIIMVFPLWVLLVSIYILIDNLHRPPQAGAIGPRGQLG